MVHDVKEPITPELARRFAERRRTPLYVEQDNERDTINVEGVVFPRDFFRAATCMGSGDRLSVLAQFGYMQARLTLDVTGAG